MYSSPLFAVLRHPLTHHPELTWHLGHTMSIRPVRSDLSLRSFLNRPQEFKFRFERPFIYLPAPLSALLDGLHFG